MDEKNNKSCQEECELEMNNGIPKDYCNSHYVNIEDTINQVLGSREICKDIDKFTIFSQMRRISFELSNMCVYSHIHKRCPTAWEKEKIILPSSIVKNVIDELSKIDYTGVIAFHIDNEPLIDPRLFTFINYATEKCPNCKVHILTNGFYLNQTMAEELCDAKVWLIMTSAYDIEEFKRLKSLKVNTAYRVFYSVLDSRKFMYNRKELNLNKACFALLNDVSVACTGDIIPCCLDWKHMHSFGNLNEESLESILNSKEITKICIDLAGGKRDLHLCKRCNWGR